MSDLFRQAQKRLCHDHSRPRGRAPYGCPCCRRIANLRRHKASSRRLARARLAAAFRRETG
jgi:hypothetical protein